MIELILEYGFNEYGQRQYFLDEEHMNPVCPVTLKPYTNQGYGLISPEVTSGL